MGEESLKQKRFTTGQALAMLIMISIAAALFYGFCYASFSVFLGTIVDQLGYTDAQRTAITGSYPLGLISSCIIAGILFDKFSAKKLFMVFCILLCSGSLMIRGTATAFPVFYLGMWMFGVSWGFQGVGANKLMGLWFSRKGLNNANALWTACSPIGQLIGFNFGYMIVTNVGGWQNLYKITSVLGIALFVLFIFLVKERGNEDAALTTDAYSMKKEHESIRESLKAIFKSRLIWVLLFGDFFCLGVVFTAGTWGSYILQHDAAWNGMITAANSGKITMFMSIGCIIGYFLIPKLISVFGGQKNYPRFAICTGILAVICFMAAYKCHNFHLAQALMLLGGIGQGGIVPASKILMFRLPEISGPRVGLAYGVMNTLQRVGNLIFATLVGNLVVIMNSSSDVMLILYTFMFGAPVCVFIFSILMKKAGRVNI